VVEESDWLRDWLSEPRLHRYITDANHDGARAFDTYVWNGKVAAAFLRDISDAEVLIRNAFDRALTKYWKGGETHWVLDPASPILAVRWREGGRHEHMDLNGLSRQYVVDALRKAGGLGIATPGKILASLTFGFWVAMTFKAREHDLWVPYISRAFASPHPPRKKVESRMRLLNELRNRVAHHEPLVKYDLDEAHERLLELCDWLSPNVRAHIAAHTDVPRLLAQRP
jgi:Abi-like protein